MNGKRNTVPGNMSIKVDFTGQEHMPLTIISYLVPMMVPRKEITQILLFYIPCHQKQDFPLT